MRDLAFDRGYKLGLALGFLVLQPLEEFKKLRRILAHFHRWDATVLFVLRLVGKSSFLRKPFHLFGRRTLTVNTKSNRALSLRPFSNDIFIFHEVWEDEYYLVDEIAAAAEDGVVVDIGAHIGFFSLFAIDVLRARKVIALEPSGENFLLLRQNTSDDSLSVEAYPVAVGDDNEQMPLFLSAQNTGGHSLKTDHHQGVELVRSLSPSRAFQLAGIQGCEVLKMDCEGSELHILTQMPAALLRSISVIAIEYHLPIYGEEGLDRMRATLEKNGFVVQIRPTGSRLGLMYAVQSRPSSA